MNDRTEERLVIAGFWVFILPFLVLKELVLVARGKKRFR